MNRARHFDATRSVIAGSIRQKAFPAAIVEVGDATRLRYREAFGTLTYDPGAPATAEDTVFDLASLTKVLATAPLVLQLVERGVLGLDDPVQRYVPAWHGEERAAVTIRDLLSHCSGLPAWRPLYEALEERTAYETAIALTPLEYEPRTKSIYSDLGFMLLGFILGRDTPLPARFARLMSAMGIVQDIQFNPPPQWGPRIAPTEIDPWRGRLLAGEVHDENAHALGGAAGHAGLFGTAASVGDHARHLLKILGGRHGVFSRAALEVFVTRRADVPGSSRALGWDTMLPTSSCGTRLSPRAFGHTGYSGTSLWIDPDREIYVVLLTNRVHPTRENDLIKQVRRDVHDAVIEDLT